ncbi:MAG: redoxin domain-containing protein [Candidatus Tectimicrobiota bacterium]
MPEGAGAGPGHSLWRFIRLAALLLVAYVVLRRLAAILGEPAMVLPPPAEREPFRAEVLLPDLQGAPIRLADLRGRPVLLNFWAVWCAPCREEIPSMQALYERYYPRGLALLAIANDSQGAAVVRPFVQTHRVTFPVLLDPQNVVSGQLQIPGIPTTYVLDKQGRIAGFALGARDWNSAEMHQFFEQLLVETETLALPGR